MLLFINPQKHRLSLAYHKSILIGSSLSPCAFDPLLALDYGIRKSIFILRGELISKKICDCEVEFDG